MGLPFPVNAPSDGDDPSYSPRSNDRSLLGTDVGGNTRRLLVDANRALNVHVIADDTTVSAASASALAAGQITSHPHSTLATVVTYAAPSDKRITKVIFSGTVYAKFELFINTVLVATKRTGPERSGEFCFETPLGLASGGVLDLKVTHCNTGLLENFDASVFGV